MSVCWNGFIPVTTWDGTDLDMILENGDRLFKFLNQYRLLGVDDLPRTVNIYGNSVDMFLLDNKTDEITLNAYLISVREIIESCLNIGSGTSSMISSGYIFGIIWGKDCVYLFDSHSKDYEGNISQNGSAILMKYENLDNLQDYIKLIYYSSQHHKTLYFQMQFISIRCSNNLRERFKAESILNRPKQCITKKRKLQNSQAPEVLSVKKRKNHTFNKFISETGSFVGRSIHKSKIVQGTHHQGDIRYGSTVGIQCLCISLMAVDWSVIKSTSRWDNNDLDRTLRKGDELFKIEQVK